MILKRAKKIGKWIFSILLSLCLLISLGLYLFQDKIISSVLDEVNSNLTSPIKTDEVELTFWSSFPNLQVKMKNVTIEDALKEQSQNNLLFFSKSVDLSFSPFDFFDGNYKLKSIKIAPGELNLFSDSTGKVNYDIVKKTNNDNDFAVKLKHISFHDFNVSYDNQSTHQRFHSTLENVSISGDLSNEKFNLSTHGTIYLKNYKSNEITLVSDKKIECDVEIDVDQKKKIFNLEPSLIKVSSLPFSCFGKIEKDSLNFTVESKNILISEMVKELVSSENVNLDHLKGEGNIDFKLHLNGGTKTNDPTLIACNFEVNNASLIEPLKGTKITGINLSGLYSNNGGELEEKIEIKNFNCKSESGPIEGKFTLKNFKSPHIFGLAKGQIDLKVIQNIFRFKAIKSMKGILSLNSTFDFSKKNKKSDFNFKSIQAQIDLLRTNIELRNDKRLIQDINGKIDFNGKDLTFKNVKLKIGKSDIQLKGKLHSFINRMSMNQTLNPDFEIVSQHLNIDELLESGIEEENASDYTIPSFIHGTVSLKAKELIYDSLNYQNIHCNVKFGNQRIDITNGSFTHANSNWNGSLAISEPSLGTIDIDGDLKSKNADLKSIFEHWNNLGQDVFLSQNIVSGKSELKLKFHFPYILSIEDFDYDKINSEFKIKIPDLHLRNVGLFDEITESLKENSSKFILGNENIDFLNRKLKDLHIYNFDNTIKIVHGNIVIPKMNLESSAMHIELTAIHGFNDLVDYRVVIPYRGLIQTEKETKFGIVEKEGEGISLFLKMYGHLDDLKFEWDKSRHKKEVVQSIKAQSNEIKSMLKKDFGMFSNKKSIDKYEEPKKNDHEVIKLSFDSEKQSEKIENDSKNKSGEDIKNSLNTESKKKKNGLLKRTLNNWKNQEEAQNEEEKIKINR